MNDYISWGQEYLDEAERIKRRLLVIRAERDYDIAGEQAQRVQMLLHHVFGVSCNRPCAAKARKEGGFVSGYKPPFRRCTAGEATQPHRRRDKQK